MEEGEKDIRTKQSRNPERVKCIYLSFNPFGVIIMVEVDFLAPRFFGGD